MDQALVDGQASAPPDNTALLEYFQQKNEEFSTNDLASDLETLPANDQLGASMTELSKLYQKPDKASLGLGEPIPIESFDGTLRSPNKQQDSRSRGNLDGLSTITGIEEGKLSGFISHPVPKITRPSE
jgi:hypothetical protein